MWRGRRQYLLPQGDFLLRIPAHLKYLPSFSWLRKHLLCPLQWQGAALGKLCILNIPPINRCSLRLCPWGMDKLSCIDGGGGESGVGRSNFSKWGASTRTGESLQLWGHFFTRLENNLNKMNTDLYVTFESELRFYKRPWLSERGRNNCAEVNHCKAARSKIRSSLFHIYLETLGAKKMYWKNIAKSLIIWKRATTVNFI